LGGVGGRPAPGLALRSALTAALPALTRNLALELAPIRVNLLAAGFVDTAWSAAVLGDQLEVRRDQLRATLPMMASGVTFAAVAYAIGFRDGTVSDPDFVRVLPQMAWMILLLGAGFAGLLLVLTASILSLQTGVLPRWLAWLGVLVAIVLLFDVIYINIVPLLVWVLAASIVLLMRREETADATELGPRAIRARCSG
jgi:hypothetical protein